MDYNVRNSLLEKVYSGRTTAEMMQSDRNGQYASMQNQYAALKTALISAFGKSQTQKDNELFSICGLGDRKPSSLLRKIESLNNDADTLRRAFFLAQLPSQVCAILASQNFADIHDLALTADRIVEANNLPQPAVNTIDRRKTPTNHVKRSGPETHKPSICYFHRRFGPDARTCRSGCRFAKLLQTTTTTNPTPRETRSPVVIDTGDRH